MSTRHAAAATIVLALAVLVALPAAPAGHALAAAPWLRVRTAHFELVGDVGTPALTRVGQRFEQFRDAFNQIFPGTRQAPAPVVIIVFPSKRAFGPFMPIFQGRRVDVAGSFLARHGVNYITLALDGGDHGYRVVFHEYTHLLVAATLADVPVWFDEGLAEYYSSFAVSDDGRTATLGRAIDAHVEAARMRLIPLRELVDVRHDSPLYNEGERRSLFYAQSWALVHYLLTESPERRAQLQKYLTLYARGAPGAKALAEAFPDAAGLERDLRDYVKRFKFGERTVTLADPVVRNVPTSSEAMAEADAEATLGDLLLQSERLAEAAAHLDRALALRPGHVRATASLGRLRHLQSRDEEALRLLEQATARADADYLPAYYHAAVLLRAEKGPLVGLPPELPDARRAAALLEGVVARQPNLADAHALLGYARMVNGQPQAAVDSLLRAYAISPRQEYALMTAQAHIVNRDAESARTLLTALVDHGDTAELEQRARNLLERISATEQPVRASSPAPSAPALRKVEAGETRALGVLTEIACERNSVVLVVTAGGGPGSERRVRVGARSFADIAFISHREDLPQGMPCGPRTTPEPVYVTWRRGGLAGTDGRAVAVEFLPPGYTP